MSSWRVAVTWACLPAMSAAMRTRRTAPLVASRAWAEAWISNRWVGFDVSQGSNAGGGHIKLAVGLDYRDACPVRGIRLGGGEEVLSTTSQVRQAGP